MAFLSGAGKVLNVAGTLASGFSQFKTAEDNAALINQATSDKLREKNRKLDRRLAQQRVDVVSSGVELEGSPLLALEETLRIGEQDLDAIQKTGKGQERAQRTKGRGALFGSLFKAGTTLLTKKPTIS